MLGSLLSSTSAVDKRNEDSPPLRPDPRRSSPSEEREQPWSAANGLTEEGYWTNIHAYSMCINTVHLHDSLSSRRA
jgi:hypothetical protein